MPPQERRHQFTLIACFLLPTPSECRRKFTSLGSRFFSYRVDSKKNYAFEIRHRQKRGFFMKLSKLARPVLKSFLFLAKNDRNLIEPEKMFPSSLCHTLQFSNVSVGSLSPPSLIRLSSSALNKLVMTVLTFYQIFSAQSQSSPSYRSRMTRSRQPKQKSKNSSPCICIMCL